MFQIAPKAVLTVTQFQINLLFYFFADNLFWHSYGVYGLYVLIVGFAKDMSARLVIRHKVKRVKVRLRI